MTQALQPNLRLDPAGPAATCRIVTQVRHRLVTVQVRNGALIWVQRGAKTLLGALGAQTFRAGEAVVLAHGTQWDVINDPADHGTYEALVLQFGDDAVARFQATHGAAFAAAGCTGFHRLAVDADLAEAVGRATGALQQGSVASGRVARHRLDEVLILLAERGCVLVPRAGLSWAERVRRLVAQSPATDWNAAQVARWFNISASTLNRRLAGERGSVAALVREVRLELGLVLLQTTTLPVGEVATQCGYESHSRFTAAFRSRYGFAPSLLRG